MLNQPKNPKNLTPQTAARHEAVYLRMAALTKQAEAIAAKRPETPVPEAVRVVAEGLLFDCRPFVSRHPGRALPVAAPLYGALAAQLGQALAGLVGFEARYTHYHPKQLCYVWRVGGEVLLPVQRLRPQLVSVEAERESAEMANIRAKLAKRIQALVRGEDRFKLARTYPPRPVL